MVVSIDITGVLEERLRRLVDLGIYASVSEAVREAVRRLMEQINLVEIALLLYTSRDVTLQYACSFAGTDCSTLIDNFLRRGMTPLLGSSEMPPPAEPGDYLLTPSAVYVVYNSYLGDVLSELVRHEYTFYVPREVRPYQEALEARALHFGIVKSLLKIKYAKECGKPPKIDNSDIMISDSEKKVLAIASTCGYNVISSDMRLRKYLVSTGLKVRPALSLLEAARASGLLEGEALREAVISLRSIPIIIPVELRETIS